MMGQGGVRAAVALVSVTVCLALGGWYFLGRQEVDLSLSKATEAGLYRIAIAPETEPFHREVMHAWVFTLTDRSGKPVEGAEITVGGGMPGHGHGLPTLPRQTRQLPGGRYEIDGFRFTMAGLWVLDVRVRSGLGEDRAMFNLSL